MSLLSFSSFISEDLRLYNAGKHEPGTFAHFRHHAHAAARHRQTAYNKEMKKSYGHEEEIGNHYDAAEKHDEELKKHYGTDLGDGEVQGTSDTLDHEYMKSLHAKLTKKT